MKTSLIVLGTLAISAASLAFAQQSAPASERPSSHRMERHQERMKAADTDKDGQISKAEAEKAMPRLFAHFDAVDTNKDAKLSQDEMRALAAKMRGHRHHHHAVAFRGADINRDRILTREEVVQYQQKMLQDFDAADTNKDGKLLAEERKAWHDKMRAQRLAQPAAPSPAK